MKDYFIGIRITRFDHRLYAHIQELIALLGATGGEDASK
jgi:hypothetical protein